MRGKLSIVPGQVPSTNSLVKSKTDKSNTLEGMDFSKPERYLREILEFLQQVTIINDINPQRLCKSFSGADASLLIHHLIHQLAPNYTELPKFETHEIQSLFASLKYPHQIRNDAITAVGAPSTIGYLMRAIYWLFLVTKVYYLTVSKSE